MRILNRRKEWWSHRSSGILLRFMHVTLDDLEDHDDCDVDGYGGYLYGRWGGGMLIEALATGAAGDYVVIPFLGRRKRILPVMADAEVQR